MTVVKENDCNSRKVISLVTRTVRGAKAATDVGAELSFILPAESRAQFSDLFDEIESKVLTVNVCDVLHHACALLLMNLTNDHCVCILGIVCVSEEERRMVCIILGLHQLL